MSFPRAIAIALLALATFAAGCTAGEEGSQASDSVTAPTTTTLVRLHCAEDEVQFEGSCIHRDLLDEMQLVAVDATFAICPFPEGQVLLVVDLEDGEVLTDCLR